MLCRFCKPSDDIMVDDDVESAQTTKNVWKIWSTHAFDVKIIRCCVNLVMMSVVAVNAVIIKDLHI